MWVWDILVLGTLRPWDPWILEPLDLGTLRPLPTSNNSSYFPIHPLTSSCLFLLVSSFGMVCLGGEGGWVGTLEDEIGNWPLTFILILKSCGDLLLPSTFSSSANCLNCWPLETILDFSCVFTVSFGARIISTFSLDITSFNTSDSIILSVEITILISS